MPPLTGTRATTTSCSKNSRLESYSPEPRSNPSAAGTANLKDSYGLIKDGELWLLNCHIGPYEHGNYANHAALRTRKLLVHKEEIRKLIGKTQQKGLTLIPTRMYFKNGKIKVELALAKGKQLWDKRETERRRTADKEAREAISRSRKQAWTTPIATAACPVAGRASCTFPLSPWILNIIHHENKPLFLHPV